MTRTAQLRRINAGNYIDPDPPKDWEPTYTLDKQVSEARAQMGERRWNELNKEWLS